MPVDSLRRIALAALAGLAAAALAACNAPQATAVDATPRPPAVKIASIAVDTSDLAALSSDPIGAWVQSALPGPLARAFEPYMAPGDPEASALTVRISSVALGPSGPAGALNSIGGAATLRGRKTTTVTLNTSVPYVPTPAEQPSSQPTLKRRVDALARAFADWLPRKFDL